jgi:hypothetical protein
MRTFAGVLAVGLFLVAVSLLPVANHAAAAVDVEIGDYWKYNAATEVEEMSLSGTIKMKVTGTEGSGASEVFVIELTGSGEASGNVGGITASGIVDYTGETKRLKSNFSLVSSDIHIAMSIKASGQTMKMTMGILQTYDPALDDFIGDKNPVHGATIVSRSNVTTTTTTEIEIPGIPAQSDSDTSSDLAVQTIRLAASNESVTVPAGTFDCYKYTYEIDTGGSFETLTYYYSDKVGNFVKQEGATEVMGGFGNSQLKSYSHGGKGSAGVSSLFSGTNLLVIIVMVVTILVVVLLVLILRKRGKAVAPMQMQMPPPEMGYPPPPPGT